VETTTITDHYDYLLRPVPDDRARVPTRMAVRNLRLERVSAARSGDRLYLVGRGVVYGSEPPEQHLVLLGQDNVWGSIATAPPDVEQECGGEIGTLVLRARRCSARPSSTSRSCVATSSPRWSPGPRRSRSRDRAAAPASR